MRDTVYWDIYEWSTVGFVVDVLFVSIVLSSHLESLSDPLLLVPGAGRRRRLAWTGRGGPTFYSRL